MAPIILAPIGRVYSPRTEAKDDFWGNLISIIELDGAQFTEDSVLGLTDFSHILVVYGFPLVPDDGVLTGPIVPEGIRTGRASEFSPNGRKTGQTNLASRFASCSK